MKALLLALALTALPSYEIEPNIPHPCTGDYDQDHDVDKQDLEWTVSLIPKYIGCGANGDWDGDCYVTTDDVLIVIAHWGECN